MRGGPAMICRRSSWGIYEGRMTSIASARQPVVRASVKKTRDGWVAEVATAMVPWFADLGFPLPDFRISTGFPRTGGRSREIAEAWSEDGGGSFTIIVRPDQTDPYRVAAALAHHLARIAAGPRDEHGHPPRHIAVSLGLRGHRTESLFKTLAAPILEQAGPLPGYLARVSRKWLDDAGAPHCPLHGEMQVSG